MPYTNRQLLLQSPSLWRSAQLAAARVRVIEDATAADLVGTRTPADGDEGKFFGVPSLPLPYTQVTTTRLSNSLSHIEFERVWQIWNAATENFNTQTRFKYDIENLRNQDPAHNAGVFLSALNELVGFLCDETDAGKELYMPLACLSYANFTNVENVPGPTSSPDASISKSRVSAGLVSVTRIFLLGIEVFRLLLPL